MEASLIGFAALLLLAFLLQLLVSLYCYNNRLAACYDGRVVDDKLIT